MYTAIVRKYEAARAPFIGLLAASCLLAACGTGNQAPAPELTASAALGDTADFVFRGGAVYTVDAERSWAEALAVRDGRIVFVGNDEDAAAWIGSQSRLIELEGRMVVPGFQDAHIHPISGGIEALSCDLNDADEVEQYLAIVRQCVEDRPGDGWFTGGGWSMSAFGPGALASKALLDEIVSDRPVYLPSQDGHSAWVNSRALEIAGITAATPDPADGRIDRDPASGEAIGSLQEGAMDLVAAHLPPVTLEDRVNGLRHSIRMLNAYGITAIQDASVEDADLQAYAALDGVGELSLRVVAAQWWEREQGLEQIAGMRQRREQYTRGRVNAGSVKIMQDGVMENYTAAMLDPYLVEGSPRGIPMIEPEFLKEAVAALDAEGFQVHFHAIGDAAVRQSLDAVEHALERNGDRDLRHHISHLELIHADDIARFAALNVVANFQPLWAYPDEYITELTVPFIGPERAQWLYPIGSVLESGGTIAFGSDWSVSTANPFAQMEVAVRRADPLDDDDGEVLLPGQTIALADAIAAFTINAAFVNRLENETGSLEVGKAADLAVLDRNLFEIDAHELSATEVVMTMIAGEIVYEQLTDSEL